MHWVMHFSPPNEHGRFDPHNTCPLEQDVTCPHEYKIYSIYHHFHNFGVCTNTWYSRYWKKSCDLSIGHVESSEVSTSDAGERMFRFGGRYYSCWCPGSRSRQSISRHGIDSIGWGTCRAAPLRIGSSSVEQNTRYDTKCEYIFNNL